MLSLRLLICAIKIVTYKDKKTTLTFSIIISLSGVHKGKQYLAYTVNGGKPTFDMSTAAYSFSTGCKFFIGNVHMYNKKSETKNPET